jgi:NAD(P)H dehydrogenase (quinone)
MLAVTGATGQLGHLVIDALLEETSADAIIAIGRNADKGAELAARGIAFRRADYDDPSTLGPALAGSTRMLLISGSEVGKREAQHRAVIDAAVAARIELIAYTSILHAPSSPIGLAVEHRATEALLRASGLPATLLRNGWYAENYGGKVPTALQHGLIGCAGDGRICPATRADFATAAARVLLDEGHAGKTYELAGDDGFTMPELAAEISLQSGRPVKYTNLSQADYAAALARAGLPAPIAAMLADSDAGVAQGALDDDSHDLSRLIGRPTTPITKVIREALAAID